MVRFLCSRSAVRFLVTAVCITLVAAAYADETAADATATITITPGNTPKAVVIATGARVRFVNNDVRPHDLESDPHPMHNDCPEANGAGLLVPGGNGMTAAFMTPRTCGIHDHNDPGNAAWMSRIVIR